MGSEDSHHGLMAALPDDTGLPEPMSLKSILCHSVETPSRPRPSHLSSNDPMEVVFKDVLRRLLSPSVTQEELAAVYRVCWVWIPHLLSPVIFMKF